MNTINLTIGYPQITRPGSSGAEYHSIVIGPESADVDILAHMRIGNEGLRGTGA